MRGLIQNTPAWMAQVPLLVATTAEGNAAISGVVDGDLIVIVRQSSSAPSTPSGYTSFKSGTEDGDLYFNCVKKTASSESGSWPCNERDAVIVFRNATGIDLTGAIYDRVGTGNLAIAAASMTYTGVFVAVGAAYNGSYALSPTISSSLPGASSFTATQTVGTSNTHKTLLSYKKLGPGSTPSVTMTFGGGASGDNGALAFSVY